MFVARRLALLLALLAALTTVAAAQQEQRLSPLTYRLSMSRPVSHLFEITIEVGLPNDASRKSLDFQMPKWAPGRYAVFDFAKNVQEVSARLACPPGLDCNLASPPITRVDDQTWRVATGGFKPPQGQLTLFFNYKVFGNDLSGTFSQLDARHANFNGGSLFMYVAGHKQDPVGLVIDPRRAGVLPTVAWIRAISVSGSFPTGTS